MKARINKSRTRALTTDSSLNPLTDSERFQLIVISFRLLTKKKGIILAKEEGVDVCC